MNQIAQTCCSRNCVLGRPWSYNMLPGIQSAFDWRIGQAFNSLTASSRYLCSKSLFHKLEIQWTTQLLMSGSTTSSPSSTCSSASLAPVWVFFSSWMVSFSYSNVSWADGFIIWRSWNQAQCYVFHRPATIETNVYEWNTINSILSIRTYINTGIHLMPTILLSLTSFTLFRTFQSLWIIMCSCAHSVLTWQAGIIFAGRITCSAISYHVALWISTKNIFRLCPSINLKALARQLLYEIFPYIGSITTCLCVYIPIYSSSYSPCCKVHLNIEVGMNSSFRPLWWLMKSISSFQWFILIYKAWCWLGDGKLSLPFNNQ